MSASTPSADSNIVRFVLDGKVVEVANPVSTRTVLEFLREDLGRTGTKEGCAEGDCGACTVVIGELTPDGETVTYRPINSCIRFLPTLDGKELVTVESLRACGAPAHPVQRAMVDQHASQCGFCTPGFVMSLFALYLDTPLPERTDVVDAISGNLCRCTGYRPIIDAGCRMGGYPAPQRWSREDAKSAARVEALKALQRGTAAESLQFPGFHAPRTLDELAAALAARPDSLVLAGGTDVGLWVTQALRELPPIVYVADVAELKRIENTPGGLRIGAGVTLSDAWPTLVAAHPALAEQARRFASAPIQSSATLCGNVANGSPIGDSIPALMALGARLELRHGAKTRSLPLEALYLGYQRKDLAPGEFVVAVTVPHAAPGRIVSSYKLAKRFEQDISAVCATFAITLREELVAEARLAFGGMAAIPKRAAHAESALVGQPFSAEAMEAACRALANDFEPLTDMRATREYRLLGAQNLLRRFYLQHSRELQQAGKLENAGQARIHSVADVAPVSVAGDDRVLSA